MIAPEYPIGTLAQMAAIPAEAQPRFIAELPAILAEFARIATVRDQINSALAGVLEMTGADLIWVDDDKGMTTITVNGPDDLGGIVVQRKTGAA